MPRPIAEYEYRIILVLASNWLGIAWGNKLDLRKVVEYAFCGLNMNVTPRENMQMHVGTARCCVQCFGHIQHHNFQRLDELDQRSKRFLVNQCRCSADAGSCSWLPRTWRFSNNNMSFTVAWGLTRI